MKYIIPMANLLRYFIAPLLLAALVLAVGYCRGNAAPPEGTDPTSPIAQWFGTLRNPGGQLCCGLDIDCRQAEKGEIIDRNGELYIFLNGQVQKIDQDKIVSRPDNPLGATYVCRSRHNTISTLYCVIPFGGL